VEVMRRRALLGAWTESRVLSGGNDSRREGRDVRGWWHVETKARRVSAAGGQATPAATATPQRVGRFEGVACGAPLLLFSQNMIYFPRPTLGLPASKRRWPLPFTVCKNMLCIPASCLQRRLCERRPFGVPP